MVKIAIIGSSGGVAKEVIDVLLATKKHELLLLTRQDTPTTAPTPGTTKIQADYTSVPRLTQILTGVHTILSFIAVTNDPESTIQKNLIDAAIAAGVKRFAPSEWASAGLEQMPWYAYKAETRRYLAEVNREKKILEYTLFQPGLFLNAWTHPYQSAKHVPSIEFPIDFLNRRAILIEGSEDHRFTITTVQDIAHVVARAIDFEGEWPVVGGIRGRTISIEETIALGERIRAPDAPFAIETLSPSDLKAGKITTSWAPRFEHPSIPPEQVEVFSAIILAGVLSAISAGDYESSDEWNRLLPDYEFTQPEEFLAEAWRGKP
ncbi:NAD(P)-binding protein [Aspergillus heteromorphus CBS 117.55]|uniref:NAD(P)-binding protein n=1 Tax=Aspergillus heteromorphus CBS 117.55 TaxID=1448321 RepID=A0A317WTF0_9EURO|nr:NAD(P)-binding protein [Aspergillus heteromorphus CBS 117.55]PWY88208.1 NAD(P)-binding protein [Aspergillus heteromorphus CBS 117.55]